MSTKKAIKKKQKIKHVMETIPPAAFTKKPFVL